MSGTVSPPFPKGAVINDGSIIVEPGALKHDTQFHDGVRKPTEADIRTVFKMNAKHAVPTRDASGDWQWLELGNDPQDKGRLRKRNNMCFRVVGTQYRVFHYHKGWYDD